MTRPTFCLRDLFWLVLAVGIGLGWWLDQDRIRRETLRMQALPVKSAETKLRLAEADLAQIKSILKRVCISESELRRCELQVEVAKAELETALARQSYVPKTVQFLTPNR